MEMYTKSEILTEIVSFLTVNPKGIIELLGPTASGKTGLSIELSEFLDKNIDQKIEVISVDSRQVFRDCDISSAKITTEEMQGVPHHGLDLVNPDEPFTVVQFQRYAFETIEAIQARGNIPVLCGGTMLWLDAISENYVFSEDKAIDPETGELAFEKSVEKAEPRWPVFKVGLHWDRAKLYERINQRAHLQFDGGMIEETKMILEKYPTLTNSAFTSFGYQEIKAYLDGELSYDEALALNQKRNRKYAKRQLTWWRGRADVNWIDLN